LIRERESHVKNEIHNGVVRKQRIKMSLKTGVWGRKSRGGGWRKRKAVKIHFHFQRALACEKPEGRKGRNESVKGLEIRNAGHCPGETRT